IHFVHEGGVHARASHDLANDERPEVIGPDVLERALVSAHRGPHSAHDHRFRHSGIPPIAPSHGRIWTSGSRRALATLSHTSPGWPSTTGRRSRNSRGGGPGSKASLRRLIPPLRGTFSPRLPGPLHPSFVVGNVYPPSSVRRRVRLEQRPFGGFARGGLPVGCRQCTDGSTMVLFVTGICSFHCFYCPVSDEKMDKDVVFADEKRVTRDEDVLEEARAIRATGAGITGGDPLDAVERTCRYIRLLRGEFGPGFHTHLYTMSTDPDKIRALADAGLDEIRFHVPPGLWSRAAASAFVPASRLARSLGLTVG